jgi:hypothetical protein
MKADSDKRAVRFDVIAEHRLKITRNTASIGVPGSGANPSFGDPSNSRASTGGTVAVARARRKPPAAPARRTACFAPERVSARAVWSGIASPGHLYRANDAKTTRAASFDSANNVTTVRPAGQTLNLVRRSPIGLAVSGPR